MALIDSPLFDVAFLGRDQRAFASKSVGAIEDLPLGGRQDRHLAGLAAFSPRFFKHNPITTVGIARPKFDSLLAPQTKRLLELETHPHILVLHARKLRSVYRTFVPSVTKRRTGIP